MRRSRQQLHPMLGGAQKPVGVVQADGVVAADVPAVAQRVQRRQGAGDPQRLVDAPVHQLQQLDRELDVAQSPGPELDLAGHHVGGEMGHDAAAHRLHVGDEIRPVGRAPDHRSDRVEVGLAE